MLPPSSQSIIAANITLAALTILAVSLRLLARRKQREPLKGDDYLIVTALIIAIGLCVDGIYAGFAGVFAQSYLQQSDEDINRNRTVLWIDYLLCYLVYGIIKLSILLFYRRIFVSKIFRNVTYAFSGVVIAWMFAGVVAHLCITIPLSAWFHQPRSIVTRFKYELFTVVMAGIDMGLDIFTWLLPIPMIIKLHMSSKKKLSLISVFALGLFCLAASAVRMYYCWRFYLVIEGRIPFIYIADITTWLDVWAHIEACTSIITACLPTLLPLFRTTPESPRFFHKIQSFLSLRDHSLDDQRNQSVSGQSASSVLTASSHVWNGLPPRTETKISHSTSDQDLEVQRETPMVITVEKTFGCHVEQDPSC